MKPALTPEEWARPESEIDIACGVVWAGLGGVTTGDLEARGEAPPHLNLTWQTVQDEIAVSRRHALAALALHGQHFGPTWAMVDGLRDVLLYRMLTPSERNSIEATVAFVVALLPPRGDDGPQEKRDG